MASAGMRLAGDITEVYLTDNIEIVTLTAIENAVATTANRIGEVTTPGEISQPSDIISANLAGEEFATSIPGQKVPGSYDMTVLVDFDSAKQNELRADTGKTTQSLIVAWRAADDAVSYAHMDVRVADASVSSAVGEFIEMNLSFTRLGGVEYFHKA